MTARTHAAIFAVAFIALAVALFLLNGRYAYHPTDDGFVLAYSWRVVNGEVPYRDFLYVRTPLSPYLHTAELRLPDGWAIQAGRLAFYLELAAAGALPAVWAATRLGVRASGRALALSAIFYLFAVHNFPPMPWPTVDAVLLSSAALTAALFSMDADASAGRRSALRAFASVLVALAVLAKQTFAPLAVLLVAYSMVEAVRERSFRPLAMSAVPGALIGAAAVLALAAAGALPELVHQVLEPARLRPSAEVPWSGDLGADGLVPYLRALDPLAVFLMAAAFTVGSRGASGRLPARAAALGLLAGVAVLAIEAQVSVFTAGRHLGWTLLSLLVGSLGSTAPVDRRAALALGGILATAWCASLSFAYQTPLLGLAGAGVFVERAIARVSWPAAWLAVALATGIVAAGVVRLDLDRPYRDLPRDAQVADLGAIFPRFGHLYTNAANAERFAELRDLIDRYAFASASGFVVLPDHPLIHYLTGTRNPLSIDWLQPQEYLGRSDRLRDEIASRRPTVILEREPGLTVGPATSPIPACGTPPDTQEIVAGVATGWVLVAEARYFCVYRAR